MDLYTFALWLVIGLVVLSVTGGIAVGLGKLFALRDRVVKLEIFAGEAVYELASQEFKLELGLMRDQLKRIQFDVDELHSRSESEAV